MYLQAKEHQKITSKHQKLEEARKDFLLEPSKENIALISDFCTPENERINLCCFKLPSFGTFWWQPWDTNTLIDSNLALKLLHLFSLRAQQRLTPGSLNSYSTFSGYRLGLDHPGPSTISRGWSNIVQTSILPLRGNSFHRKGEHCFFRGSGGR